MGRNVTSTLENIIYKWNQHELFAHEKLCHEARRMSLGLTVPQRFILMLMLILPT